MDTPYHGWTPQVDYFKVCATLTRQIDAAAGRDATIAAIESAGDCSWQELAYHLADILDEVS